MKFLVVVLFLVSNFLVFSQTNPTDVEIIRRKDTKEIENNFEEDKDAEREHAREQLKATPFTKRLRFGGGIGGLSFGNPTSISVSPMVGYQADIFTVVGLGLSYNYYSLALSNTTYKYNLIGYQVFARQQIPFITELLKGMGGFLTADYEQFKNISSGSTFNFRPTIMLGLGIGAVNGFGLSASYDFNYKQNESVYGSQWVIRVNGFFF